MPLAKQILQMKNLRIYIVHILHIGDEISTTKTRVSFYFTMAQQPPQWPKASSLSMIRDHTQTQHTRYDSSGRMIMSSQRPLPDNTKLSQKTNTHAIGGVRTHNPSKRETALDCAAPGTGKG